MSLYNDDIERIQEMINNSIEKAQIKPYKMFTEETKQLLIIVIGILIASIMLLTTICYCVRQAIIYHNISTFGEYNNSAIEIE